MRVDSLSQSIEAMADILKMTVEQSTELTEKLISMNAQNTIDAVKDEMIGNAIDILI